VSRDAVTLWGTCLMHVESVVECDVMTRIVQEHHFVGGREDQ